MASVRKRTWKTETGEIKTAWLVDYRDAGGKRRSKQFARRRDDDAFRRRVEDELERGIHVASRETKTFAEAAEAWLLDCERRRLAKDRMTAGTLRNYRAAVRLHLNPAFGGTRLTDLTADQIQALVNALAVRYRWSTVMQPLVSLRAILTYAVKRHWLKRSPLADRQVTGPWTRNTRVVRVPTKEDLGRILQAVSRRGRYEHPIAWRNRRLIIYLAVFAGLRRGEICGLQWENIDLAGPDGGWLHVRHNFSRFDGLKGPKTLSGLRSVPLVPVLRDLLEEYAATCGRPREGFVLLGESGRPVCPTRVTSRFWHAVMRDAGLLDTVTGSPKFNFHALRHAAVSLLIERGLMPIHISRIIGHASVAITMDVYGHLFPSDLTTRAALTGVAEQFPTAALLRLRGAADGIDGAALPADRRERALALHARGLRVTEIAAAVGVSDTTVYVWLKEAAAAESTPLDAA